jgi:hypothetical protein
MPVTCSGGRSPLQGCKISPKRDLASQSDVVAPDRAWGTDITSIRTLEGFANLAAVIDFNSRHVVGRSMVWRLRDFARDFARDFGRGRRPEILGLFKAKPAWAIPSQSRMALPAAKAGAGHIPRPRIESL